MRLGRPQQGRSLRSTRAHSPPEDEAFSVDSVPRVSLDTEPRRHSYLEPSGTAAKYLPMEGPLGSVRPPPQPILDT